MNGPLRPLDPSEGSDLLDRLLGLTPLPSPDGWFTARTLARCRSSRREMAVVPSWNHFWRRWAMPGFAVLCLAGFGLQQAHRTHKLRSHRQHSAQEAFEIMASMGHDSDSSWQDSSL